MPLTFRPLASTTVTSANIDVYFTNINWSTYSWVQIRISTPPSASVPPTSYVFFPGTTNVSFSTSSSPGQLQTSGNGTTWANRSFLPSTVAGGNYVIEMAPTGTGAVGLIGFPSSTGFAYQIVNNNTPGDYLWISTVNQLKVPTMISIYVLA